MRCEHTDYLELACIKGFELNVTTLDGESFTGKAKDIVYNEQKYQCLILVHNSESVAIPLETIAKLQSLTPNSFFSTLNLTD
ncbi:Rho-binding antiterminator [Pseudoalteromonas luteoviolacea]|uniref:Rho-binding antiterminator n=1 Tax=Pseudoalteromonas luteoviolacea TaxID=43657 RepID=UPI001B387909|nr:Rho-binding antiterminator [Pseudoalteromonas luteoviolacea]MBQ4813291.1 Rho-binding antiterminator [Pseudoalteromonas luteoviolacea]